MRLLILAAVLLSLVSTGMSVVNYIFHCRKIQDTCKNGGTCVANTGLCDCATGFTGQDCTATTFTVNVPCDPACENGGTCYQEAADSTSSLCACPYGYSGASCDSEIVEIACEVESATFALNFPSEFDGKITFVNSEGAALDTNDCPSALGNDGKTLTAVTDISDDASPEDQTCYVETEDTELTDSSSFTVYFLVNYDATIITNLDDLFALTCIRTAGEFEVSSDVSSVTFNSDNLNSVDGVEENSPVEVIALGENDEALLSEVALGAMVQLFLYLKPNSGYETLIYVDCSANNLLEGDDLMELPLLSDSCPTARGQRVGATQEAVTISIASIDQVGIASKFNAFLFPNSNQIRVVCTAKFCLLADDASCALPTQAECDARVSQQRKKRSADDEEKTVSKVFTVKRENEIKNDQNTTEEKEQSSVESLEQCMASPEITAVIAVLGAVVCMLLIVCFLLTCCLLRKRGKRVTTYDATTLQPTADRFQIPRAHVNESYGEL